MACAILGQINKNDLVVFEKKASWQSTGPEFSVSIRRQLTKKSVEVKCFKVGGRRRCVTVRQIQ